MDYLSKLKSQIRTRALLLLLAVLVFNLIYWWAATQYFNLDLIILTGINISFNLILVYFAGNRLTEYVTEPLKLLQQSILHVSPNLHGYNAPNLEKAKIGKELITNLAMQVYQIATISNSTQQKTNNESSAKTQSKSVLDNLPFPIIVLDKSQNIVYANQSTSIYLGLSIDDIRSKNIYSILDLSFNTEDTFDQWLDESRRSKVTSSKYWDRVRLLLPDQKTRRQLDLIAYYNKNNPEHAETILTIFDRTRKYNREDDGIGFIALAVHELRTPLTMLRGYIEVFEEELQGKLNSELADYLRKMDLSARQLSDFIGNILNVARVEENQLFLQLEKGNWNSILKESSKDMELKAKVHGKNITFNIDPNLPEVAVDKTSIYEVVNNLLDNAIKYSEKSNEIIVTASKREDGLVETTVQDFGVGIPSSVIGSLFEKFYRNHRTRAQIGGTGLGLYLSKAIVRAHGGQIWVQSKEEHGSTFGFTLVPYDQLADKLKDEHNKDITRTANGWIKNHSFYRS